MNYSKGDILIIVDPKNICKTKTIKYLKENNSKTFIANDKKLYEYSTIIDIVKPINESLSIEDEELIEKMFIYAIKNYPDSKHDLDRLYESYKDGADISIIIEDFKDIISEYDTIIFNDEGIPNLFDSDDIQLASYIEQVMYI